MWRIITLVLLMFYSWLNTASFAQKIDNDIIKIKNGPTIHGGLDSIRRDTVFFRVNGKIPVTYPVSQVEEFRKEDKITSYYSDKNNSHNHSNSPTTKFAKPDSNAIYFSFNTGFAPFRAISPKITLGYRLHQAFIPVVSVDYTWYNNAPGRFSGVTGGITGSTLNNALRPYYNVQMGYGFNHTTESIWDQGRLLSKSHGIKLDIGAGVIQPILDANKLLSLGLNYGTQEARYQYTSSIWNWNLSRMEDVLITEKIKYNRLYFTIGIIF